MGKIPSVQLQKLVDSMPSRIFWGYQSKRWIDKMLNNIFAFIFYSFHDLCIIYVKIKL